ncbi:tyrosine--tRNA ligase [Candidatus Amesbacteria bacterium RIFOXYB1_FULL_47_13]|nr:MAG: tyrosine--tRNA ligase [Candidatus Amesbacteria bacterium RIFOXYB1_FULL_47_13]
MDQISEFLTRGVANIIPGKPELEKLLRSDEKLNVYNGIDPTNPHVHLGNAFPLRKLRTLVELGHNVTFLIGDFTALIGDTSDKESERPVLTYEQIETNFQTYKEQASKILDFSKVQVVHNSEWLKKLNFEEVVKLTRHFTLNDFISRELIKTRLADGKSVSLPEVLYPVMQGYDSWYLDTDLQIGGTDQTFNMQAGRILQRRLRDKESCVMSLQFLTGTDGRKMSKSWGNAVWLDDSPQDMFGKIMSVKDDLILEYYTLATNASSEAIKNVKMRLDSGENPMILKKELAKQIVEELHGPEPSKAAQDEFETTIQKGELPAEIPTVTIPDLETKSIVDILVTAKLASSKSDARRFIEQGAVEINGQKVTSINDQLITNNSVVRVGNRKFTRIQG